MFLAFHNFTSLLLPLKNIADAKFEMSSFFKNSHWIKGLMAFKSIHPSIFYTVNPSVRSRGGWSLSQQSAFKSYSQILFLIAFYIGFGFSGAQRCEWNLTQECSFLFVSISSLTYEPSRKQKLVVPGLKCVSSALTSVILLIGAIAASHSTGAPTQATLKCQGPPKQRKLVCWCTGRQSLGGMRGGAVRMKDSAVAVQLFALPAQH